MSRSEVRLLFLLITTASSAWCTLGHAAEKPVQMEKFVVREKPQLAFGIAVTLWEDKSTGRVLEMHVKAVQADSMAEDKGIRPGSRIWSIDGVAVDDFDATFSAGSELGKKFLNRLPGDVIVLNVKVAGERNSRFISLTQNKFTLTVREGPGKLSASEKKKVAQGRIEVGFTRAMVSQVVGDPSKVVKMDPLEAKSELWIYKNYKVTGSKGHDWYEPFAFESSTLPSAASADFSRPGSLASSPSNEIAGGSALGVGEHTYRLMVLFKDDKVSQVGLQVL